MSVRIGWSFSRPKERKPGKVAEGFYLFQFMKANPGQGRHIVVGSLKYSREDLEQFRDLGYRLDVRVIGTLGFAQDVSSELLRATVNGIRVTGKLSSPAALKSSLREICV